MEGRKSANNNIVDIRDYDGKYEVQNWWSSYAVCWILRRVPYCWMEKTFEFLDIPNTMYQGSLTTEKRSDRRYEVEFKDVSFRYPGSDIWALRHVDMKFKVGKRLAIVSENGNLYFPSLILLQVLRWDCCVPWWRRYPARQPCRIDSWHKRQVLRTLERAGTVLHWVTCKSCLWEIKLDKT